jgi:superfamily II DNA/RNA helicase
MRGIAAAGYADPTPIQAESHARDHSGQDVLVVAQTGTGKTAAFRPAHPSTPDPGPPAPLRALVLAPTRELASRFTRPFPILGAPRASRAWPFFGWAA